MKSKNLIWIPRGIIIAYVLFVSLFSLDVVSITGFLIHSIPSFAFILILVLTWKKPKFASILFVLAGIVTMFFWNTYREWYLFLIFSIAPILAGVLFWIFKGKK